MAITTGAPDGVRVTTAAKNGTVKSFTGGKVRLEDPITTGNNGQLEASPVYTNRLILIDGGTGVGQLRLITGQTLSLGDGDDVDLDVNEAWGTDPDGTSTFQISYVQGDVASVTGATLNAKTGVLEFSRHFTVGNTGGSPAFAMYFGAFYQGIEGTDDNTGTQESIIVENNGWLQFGYLQGGVQISGVIVTGVRNTDAEDFWQFNGGCILRIYASVFRSWLADLKWEMVADATSDIDMRTLLVASFTDNMQIREGQYEDVTIQGESLTADLIEMSDGKSLVGKENWQIAQTNGLTSIDDAASETILLWKILFVNNLKNLTIHDDKTWIVIDVLGGWVADDIFIDFQVDDLNSVTKAVSFALFTQDETQTPLVRVRAYVFEGTVLNTIVNHFDSNLGLGVSEFVVTETYTFPASVLTEVAFGGFAFISYKWPKLPQIFGFSALPEREFTLTFQDDANLTESNANTAIRLNQGILLTTHGATLFSAPESTQFLNVIRFTTGVDGGDGTPSVGDTITGGTSGQTGVVVEILGDFEGAGLLVLEDRSSATPFTDAEVLTDTTQTNQWTAVADVTGGGAVDADFYLLVDCSNEPLVDVYDFLAAKQATRRYPLAVLEDDGTVFTDLTNLTDDGVTDSFRLLPAVPVANDAFYVAEDDIVFEELYVQVSTAATIGGGAGVWEYYNGTVWASLSGVTDPSNGFSSSGQHRISATVPSDQATVAVNGITAYWWRYRVTTAYTSGGNGAFVLIDLKYLDALIWSEDTEPQILKLGGNGYFTNRVSSRGVWLANRGSGTVQHFTANDGTLVVPPTEVTLTVNAKEPGGTAVEGINVRIERNDTGALIAEGSTNVSGVFTVPFNFTGDLLVNIIARNKAFEDNGATETITAAGLTIPFTMQPDTDVDLP